jgi:hypothetical protein
LFESLAGASRPLQHEFSPELSCAQARFEVRRLVAAFIPCEAPLFFVVN